MPTVPGIAGGSSVPSTGTTDSPLASSPPSQPSLMMAAATMADLAKNKPVGAKPPPHKGRTGAKSQK